MHRERKRQRLRSWDYNDAAVYFLTFCTKQKRPILAHIVGAGIPDGPQRDETGAVYFAGDAADLPRLTKQGQVVQDALRFLLQNNPEWKLHRYVIMPNHVHLLIELSGTATNAGGASGMPRPTDAAIPKLLSSLKRYSNRVCGAQLWQDGYHDHIVRDEEDFLRIWKYIEENPLKWTDDIYFSREEETL